MNRVASSLFFAFTSLLHPRMLWLMVWPMLISLLVWGVAAFLLWGATAVWMAAHLKRALNDALRQVVDLKPAELLRRRYERLQSYGRFSDTKER